MDVIGVGSLTVDIFTDSKFYISESGTRGVEHYIMFPIGKKRSGKIHIMAGGSSGNTVSYLSKLGMKTGYFTKVGTDRLSDFSIDDLKKRNVDVKHIIRDRELEIGRTLVLISKNSRDTTLIVDHGAASFLTKKEIDKHGKFLSSAKLIDLTSFTGKTVDAIKEIFKYGKVFFAPSRTMIVKHKSSVKKMVKKSKFCAMNEGEFELLFGKFEKNAKKVGVKCFVTHGANGISYFDGKRIYRVSGIRVQDVKNTTGAGDTSAAWFIYGVLNDMSPEEIIKYAYAAGAIHVQSKYVGAREGTPTKIDVEKFLKKHNLKTKIIGV